MKYSSGAEFVADKHKHVILIGPSGVGKTTASRLLPQENWFHFNVDYRIWTHQLGDQLSDYLKSQAMTDPVLGPLLKHDAITLEPRVHIDNLLATSTYMGMLGNPTQGGSSLTDFTARMTEYIAAERAAMLDIPQFMRRAKHLYGYDHFLVDASGSICEILSQDLTTDPIVKLLEARFAVVYIKPSSKHIAELLARAEKDPKPICYRPEFIHQQLPALLEHLNIQRIEQGDPRDVGAWLYPNLISERLVRYEAIAESLGYTITMDAITKAVSGEDILTAIASAIDADISAK